MANGKWKMGMRMENGNAAVVGNGNAFAGKTNDIPTRAFQVGVRVIKLCEHLLGRAGVGRLMAAQILAAGTSIGANVQEGQAAQSRADFIAKYCISLKEARETAYRMRLLIASEVVRPTKIEPLIQEVDELAKMIGRAIVTARKNRAYR